MVYDYSPSASVATLAQGLLGRMCGHGKLNHNVKVFTHLKQATAYSLFEQNKLDDFSSFVKAHSLKPSQRSQVIVSSGDGIVTEIFDSSEDESKDLIKRRILSTLTLNYGELKQFKETVIRRLTKNDFEGYWYKDILNGPLDAKANKKLLRDGNLKTSILIDDRTDQYKVYATFRLKDSLLQQTIAAKNSSIYSIL